VEEGHRIEPTNGGRFLDSAAGSAKTARERSCDVTAGRDYSKPTPSVRGSGDDMGAKSRRRSLRLAEGSQGLEALGEKGKRGQELKISGQDVRTGGLQGLREIEVGGDERQGSQPKWNPRAPEMRDEGYVRERLAVLNVGELRELLCALGLKVWTGICLFILQAFRGSIPQAILEPTVLEKRHPRVVLSIFAMRKVIRSASLIAEPVANRPCDAAWLADEICSEDRHASGSEILRRNRWQARGCQIQTQILQGQSICIRCVLCVPGICDTYSQSGKRKMGSRC
jgi:hypothetical protein